MERLFFLAQDELARLVHSEPVRVDVRDHGLLICFFDGSQPGVDMAGVEVCF